MPPLLTPTIVPTGGAVQLSVSGAVSGAATLQRAVSGQSFVTIFSGQAQSLFIDIGDGTNTPLDPTKLYQYKYTDITGTVTTPFVQPAATVSVAPEPITMMLIRLIQGGLNSLQLPAGYKLPQVTQAMPMGGALELPLVVVNLDVFAQSSVPIGQSVNATDLNTGYVSITELARRTYRISILTANAASRDYFRDNIVGILKAIYATVLQPLGLDVTHKWMVSSGQIADDRKAMAPGFFFADVLLEFDGTLDISITPTYGPINTITTASTGGDGSVTNTTVPLAS